MMLIDSHCHLDFAAFAEDIELVIERAKQNQVHRFIIPSVNKANWTNVLALCEKYPQMKCAIGIHPWFLNQSALADLSDIDAVMTSKHVVAIGECGLDAGVEDMSLQQLIFMRQIELANQYAKPLIVHHRKTHHLILQCFKHSKPKFGGVIHGFTGSTNDAKKYIELGFKLGVGGTITYERANKTKQAIKQVGLEHLLLETDSPDMPLFNQQGKRNEPKNIAIIAQQLSELLDCDVERVAEITSVNAQQLFSLTC